MKKTLLLNFLFISLLCLLDSCTSYRQAQMVDVSNMESVIVLNLQNRTDTIMTLTESPVGPSAERTVNTFFTDDQSESYCFLNSNYSNYPDTPIIQNLNWELLISSYDSIKTQQPVTAYFGTVIENDTTWEQMKPNFPTRFILYIYLPEQLIAWETNTFEMETNPSMTKTKIIKYLLNKTGRGEETVFELFGNPKKRTKIAANNK